MKNQLEFKLKIAQKFISKIPSKIPTNVRQRNAMEENSEAFLFFASGVIELVKKQINDKFEIFDRKNVFYIHGLRKHLSDNGAQKKTKSAISCYFTTPKHTKSKTAFSKSSLWKLQALRNQAMHGNIIRIQGNSLMFLYTIHDKNGTYHITQKTKNPHKYFGQLLVELEKFTSQILIIIQSA